MSWEIIKQCIIPRREFTELINATLNSSDKGKINIDDDDDDDDEAGGGMIIRRYNSRVDRSST
jgi:hypothetical protein